LLTDRDEMSNLHKGHSRDASYFNLLLWKPSAKWTEAWLEASMEGPL
jgi:hypothetical protein